MQVILREHLDKLGRVGEVVNVKPGYARNFLIPQGLAYEATASNLRRIEKEKAVADAQAQELLAEAQKRATELEGVSLTFNVRAGEEGRLFGSITSGDIADRLEEQGITLYRRSILLDEPIKSLGVFSLAVRLHPEVRPEIKVWVIKED
jgi:large subunit ribosomal protein L9